MNGREKAVAIGALLALIVNFAWETFKFTTVVAVGFVAFKILGWF